jgi:hypothetical protein
MAVESPRRPGPQSHPDSGAAEPPDALIEEARRWQRRRRWYLGGIAALLIVSGLVVYGSLNGGTSHPPTAAAGSQRGAPLQDLSVVSVIAVKPYSPTYFVITEVRSRKTVRSASVAGFKITVRNGSTSRLSRVRVTLVIDKPFRAPLVKTETLPAIGPNGAATLSFPRFVGAEFTEKTNVNIALGSEPGKLYPLSVPWA